MFRSILKTDSSISSLFLRLSLGIVVFAHGAQKMLGWYGGPGFEKTLQTFQMHMGFSYGMTIALIAIEFFCALGVLIGFLTRISVVGIGIYISAWIYMTQLQRGFLSAKWFGEQLGQGLESYILMLGIILALAIRGGGLVSVDKLIVKE